MAKFKKEPLTELQKIAKKIGPDAEDVLAELEAMDVPGLNKRIAQANAAISDTKEELDNNPAYQQVLADKKLLGSGFKEVKARQNAIIAISVQLRKDKGEA